MANNQRYSIELNSIARGVHCDTWDNMHPKKGEDISAFAQRCLMGFYCEKYGYLEPIVAPSEVCRIPDEVIVRTSCGQVIYRTTIVDEMNTLYAFA